MCIVSREFCLFFEGVLATLGFIFSVTSSSVLKISVPIIYILQLWKMACLPPIVWAIQLVYLDKKNLLIFGFYGNGQFKDMKC